MYIAFDTETTGLSSDSQLLTAYFVILDKNFEPESSLDLKFKWPSYNVYAKALEVNKIDIVKHDLLADDLAVCRSKMKSFIKNRNRLIPIGHNINFDIGFIRSSGLVSDEEFSKSFNFVNIDTLVVAQFLKSNGKIPLYQSLSLKNICSYFGITCGEQEFHTAKYDTLMTISLLKFFNKNFC